MFLKGLSLILLPLTARQAIAHTDFLPKNSLQIYADNKINTGLTETDFNQVIDEIEKIYSPIATSKGGKLIFNRNWENPTVNAGTYRDEDQKLWYVNLYGGFARHPSITRDGLSLVVCHEIGHHLGGAPKKDPNYGNPDWSSTEGQSDYFATLKCLRRVFKEHPASPVNPHDIVKNKCISSHRNYEDAQICIRMTLAGLAVANVMSQTLNMPWANLYYKDTSVAPMTFDHHPSPQCRLDTYFEGALCPIDYRRDVSQSDPNLGACYQRQKPGTRPLCWYKP